MGTWKLNGKIYSCKVSDTSEVRGLCVAAYGQWEFRLIQSGSMVAYTTFQDRGDLHIAEALLRAHAWGTQMTQPAMIEHSRYWSSTRYGFSGVWLRVARQAWGPEYEDNWDINIYNNTDPESRAIPLHTVVKQFNSEEEAQQFAFDFYLEKMVEHVA